MPHVKKHGTHYGHEQPRQDDDIGQHHRPGHRTSAKALKTFESGKARGRGASSRGGGHR
jgi:hypothetical protein